jgi:hypothetical protein
VIAPHITRRREVGSKFPPASPAGALRTRHRSYPVADANAAMNEATMVVVQLKPP